jgi:hypothetical protein
MHSELLLRLWLYCLGMLFSSSSILCKKRGFSEESLLWVEGLGKSIVGYAILFLCRGQFLFSSSSINYEGYSGIFLWAFTYIYNGISV